MYHYCSHMCFMKIFHLERCSSSLSKERT
uniref:Uncharacterized protein n=1 Tax=Anguilla anguilla TaxID=7936 RepID=A0A0E9PNY0_ANGAN